MPSTPSRAATFGAASFAFNIPILGHPIRSTHSTRLVPRNPPGDPARRPWLRSRHKLPFSAKSDLTTIHEVPPVCHLPGHEQFIERTRLLLAHRTLPAASGGVQRNHCTIRGLLGRQRRNLPRRATASFQALFAGGDPNNRNLALRVGSA